MAMKIAQQNSGKRIGGGGERRASIRIGNGGSAFWRIGRAAMALGILLAATGSVLLAQSSEGTPVSDAVPGAATTNPSSGNASGAEPGSTEMGDSRDGDAGTGLVGGPGIALSARQIIAILQRSPEIVVELKSLMADTMQQQGASVDPNTITDETLYSQIASDREVRVKITMFLRARGYLTDANLDAATAGVASDGNLSGATETPDLISPARGTDMQGVLTSGVTQGSLSDLRIPASSSGRSPAQPQRQRAETGHNITDAPEALRQPAPYNLLSLRDLYTQVPDSPERLKRFGSDVFINRSQTPAAALQGATNSVLTLDAPPGPDYIVGPGDSLTIDMWGGVSQSLTRVIDRDGRIMLPEAGDAQLAGLTLADARSTIANALQQQFRNAQVSVTISRLRTVRVYVVGDVERPGAYDISALSSPLSALYAAGGPTAIGSLRVLRHYRGNQLIGDVDLYDFLLHGTRGADNRLQSGDTLLVPPAGPQVAVFGAVRRPGIYELRSEKTLSEVLEDAGGATVAAALEHTTIERIDANQHRETMSLGAGSVADTEATLRELASFAVKDGDRVHVAPILPYSERVVYLEGHVVRPGRVSYRDGMKLNDVLRSYQDLLPEPSDRGEIVRLMPPDLHPETIEFQVPDALIGNNDLALEPFDTIRVFGRYELDAPKVTVSGEVLRPGSYPLSAGMTTAQLVRMAGGFKRDALLDDADLMSYRVVNGTRVEGQRADVRIGDAVLKGDAADDAVLKPGDVLTIHQMTGWNDIGSSITIEGEVAHPGSYGFQEGEHLSDLLRRAGGFRAGAYPEGAVLTRVEVRELEEKSRAELIRQIETSSAAARLSPSLANSGQSSSLDLIQAQEEQVLARLRSEPPGGRMVIHIDTDIDSWAGTPADIEVRRGDLLRIPRKPGFVLVNGQVYNATAITFSPGKTAGWYLSHAGGATAAANRKEIFVIRANGSVVGRRSDGWYGHNVLSTRLEPGDVVVVPQKIIGASMYWRNLLSGAQVASSIAIAAAVATL
jgi:protein involved in polysaccharide export with SLBB domain